VFRRLPWLGSSRDPYASLSLSSTCLLYSALPLSPLARVEPRFRLLHHRCLRPVFFYIFLCFAAVSPGQGRAAFRLHVYLLRRLPWLGSSRFQPLHAVL
jgi:hypothetical protein